MPSPLLQPLPPRKQSKLVLAGLAALAVGLFAGSWVLGPAVTYDTTAAPAASSSKDERLSYEAMLARPDPAPYRAATPTFDTANAPRYAAAAKAKAKAEVGGRIVSDDDGYDEPQDFRSKRSYGRYRSFDRHTGVMY